MELGNRAERNTFLKAFIPILITVLILEGCFIIFFYSLSAKNVKDQLGSKAFAIGNIVALFIEEDIDSYQQFIKTLDTTSEYYQRMNSAFDKILQASGERIAYIDTNVRHSDTELMYVFDGFKDSSVATHVPPGTIESLSTAGLEAYKRQEAYLGDFGSNKDPIYGNLLSAYVPVHDDNGNFVGMVTVQATYDKYQKILENLYLFAIVSLAISGIIISLILGYSLGYIKHAFSIDALTGLPNRNDLLRVLKRQQKSFKKNDSTTVVFMTDLDFFKNINDSYGHLFGDIVLRRVAQILNSNLRRCDYLARYGGEEFAGCLSLTSMTEAGEVLWRMNRAVQNTAIYNEEFGEDIYITISIGYAVLTSDNTPVTALIDADRALYEAKKTRNSVVAYTADE